MADEKDLCPPDDLSDRAELSRECFSPICEFSTPAKKCFSPMSTDCVPVPKLDFLSCESTPKMSKVFLGQEFNDDKLKAIFKQELEDEDRNEFSENNATPHGGYATEDVDFTPPRYRNNVSPAIEKLIRTMNTPISASISQTQVVCSPTSFLDSKMFNDDSVALSRQCFDTSCSPKTPSGRHSLCTSILKMTLSRDLDLSFPQTGQESSLSKCPSQEFVDTLFEKEPATSPSNCEVKEPNRLIDSNRGIPTYAVLFSVGCCLRVRGALCVDGVKQKSSKKRKFVSTRAKNVERQR